jgi:hypothetical protein
MFAIALSAALLNMYPETKNRIHKNLMDLDQSPLEGDRHLETLKERFLIAHSVIHKHSEAPHDRKKLVADMVHTSKDLKGAEKILDDPETSQHPPATGLRSFVSSAFSFPVGSGSSLFDVSRADSEARSMSHREFLAKLPALLVEEPILAEATEQIYQYFTPKFRERLYRLASEWAHYAAGVELEAFKKHCHLEATALENRDRLKSRAELLRDLEKALIHDGPLRQVFYYIFLPQSVISPPGLGL